MKRFKFNLPLNGIKVHNLEELRDNFTTEILELHTSGVLLKWLKSQNLMMEADKLSAIPADHDDVDKLVALCEIFGVNANRQVVEAALSKGHVSQGVTPREAPEELVYKKKFEELSELLDNLKIMRFQSTQNDYNDCLEAIKEGKAEEGYKLVPSEEIYDMSDGILVWMDPKPYNKELENDDIYKFLKEEGAGYVKYKYIKGNLFNITNCNGDEREIDIDDITKMNKIKEDDDIQSLIFSMTIDQVNAEYKMSSH